MLSTWHENLAEVASQENVVLKIGGWGFPWFVPEAVAAQLGDSDRIAHCWRPEVLYAIDVFGPDRCMLESNFPIDGRLCDYVTLWNALKKLTGDLAEHQRASLFVGTASRVYGIELPPA